MDGLVPDQQYWERPGSASSEGSSTSDLTEDIGTDPLSPVTGSKTSIRNPQKGKKRKGVSVYCRVRPQLPDEVENGGENMIEVGEDMKSIFVKTYAEKLAFRYDRVYDETIGQEMLYEESALPLIDEIINGYNASFVAYGQTGSGKTYTTYGPGFEVKKQKNEHTSVFNEEFINNPDLWGFVPRLVQDLFKRVERCGVDEEFIIISSFVEIYKESVNDLININKRNLTILQDARRGLYIRGASEVPVRCWEEVLEVLKVGVKNRFVASTKANADSSRSHAIFILTIYRRNHVTKVTKCSQLYLCDLAGSEKVSKTLATGTRLDEAKKINASLLALRQVIFALTRNQARKRKGGKAKHVPYRNSKLTRILENSLGGNAYCVLIMNISPSSYNESETISTLRFGERSMLIKNKPKMNRRRTVEELEMVLKRKEKRMEQQTALIRTLQLQIRTIRHKERILSSSAAAGGPSNAGGNMDLSSFYSFFVCPLSRRIMRDPVFAQDGFTYEREYIFRYLNNPKKKMLSPVTGKRLLNKQFVCNHTVKAQIEYFSDLCPYLFDNFSSAMVSGPIDDDYIPDDILFSIFRFLNSSDLIQMGKVCSQWYNVSMNNILWKQLYRQKFIITKKRSKWHPSYQSKEKESEEEEEEEIEGENEDHVRKEKEEEEEVKEVKLVLPRDCKDWREMFWKKFMKKKGKAPWNTPVKKIKESVYLFRND